MEVKDHKKATSSEHENNGVHLCHKCGWPFPNPHPSAKHRRAHKRVCGTIEGYKLTNSEPDHADLAGSDNEHLSDDDGRTPSPKIDKGSTKELGSSGGMDLKSSRSEDELFSDAVTEFSDSGVSPILEERRESIKQFNMNVGRELLHDLQDTCVCLSKVDKTADASQPLYPQGPRRTSEMSDSDAVGSKRNQSEITKSISDIRTENVSVGVGMNALACDSSQVVSEHVSVSDKSTTDSEIGKQKGLISSSPGTDMKEKEKGTEDVHIAAANEVLQSENKLEIEPKLEEIKDKSSGPIALEAGVQTTDKEIGDCHIEPEFQSKLTNVNGDTSRHGIVDEIVDQEKELTNNLQSKHDHSSQTESPKSEHVSVVTEVESDSLKNLIHVSYGQSDEVCDLKEAGNEETRLLSVAGTVPAAENSKAMIGDFKDDTMLKSSFSMDVGAPEEIRSVEDDKKVTVLENLSSAISDVPAGSIANSLSDTLEDDLRKESFAAATGGEIGNSVPENLPSAHSSVLAETVDNFSTEALEDDLRKDGVSTPIDGEVVTSVPENLPGVPAGTVDNSSSEALEDELKMDGFSRPIDGEVVPSVLENLPSVPAGTVDNSSSEALEDELKMEGVSRPIDGEVGTSVPENLPSILSSVPVGTLDKTSSEALGDDLREEGVSRPIVREVDASFLENLPSAFSSVPAGTVGSSSSEALKDDLRKDGVSTLVDGEVGSPIPENPPSSVPAGTVDNSSSKALEDDLRKEGVSTPPIDGDLFSSGFRVKSDEETHLLAVADTLPAVENPEALIGDYKDYKELKSSFPLDLGAPEEIRSEEDEKKVTVLENLPRAISNVLAGSVDKSLSDTLEADLEKEGVSIPIMGEVGACEFRETSDDDIRLSSVAETSPAVEKPKVMIGDRKECKLLQSSFPSDLGAEEIISVENDKMVTVPENLSSAMSNVPAGSVDNSSSDTLKDDLKKDGVPIPIDDKVGASGFSIIGDKDFGSSGSGDHPKTSVFETNNSQPNNKFEVSRPQSLNGKPFQNEDSELTTKEHSDRTLVESSAYEQTWETTNSSGGEKADDHDINELVHGAAENGDVQAGSKVSENLPTTLTHVEAVPETIVTHVEAVPETIVKSISLAGDDSLAHENSRLGFSSTAGNETVGAAGEGKLVKHADPVHESTYLLTNSASLQEAKGPNQADIGIRDSETHHDSSASPNCSTEIPNTSEGLEMVNETEVPRSSDSPAMVSKLKYEDPTVPSEKNSENSSSKEIAAFPVESEVPNKSSASTEDINVRDPTAAGLFFSDGKDKVATQDFSCPAADNSIVSSSRSDSLDANWGSVSVLSTRSDLTAAADFEVLSSTDTQASERIDGDFKKPQAAAVESHPDKADVFEPPSFMTLVESGVGVDKNLSASEIQTAQRDEQIKSEALQAGWFPSLTNVVNESEGRKKNEEIIAKVTNWGTGKQSSPLKNLLNEAHAETKMKSPNTKKVPAVNQADETASNNNGTAVTTVSSILGSEMPSADAVKKEIEKEWNSPARYPIQIKKEKRKGKPYWVPFVCCTSVHQDV